MQMFFKVKRAKMGDDGGREFQGWRMEKYGLTNRTEERCAFSVPNVWFVKFRLFSGVKLNMKIFR
jgi:hypothetical protein